MERILKSHKLDIASGKIVAKPAQAQVALSTSPSIVYAASLRMPWRTYGTAHATKQAFDARGRQYIADAVSGKRVVVLKGVDERARLARLRAINKARDVLKRAAEHRLTSTDSERIACLQSDPFIQSEWTLLRQLDALMFTSRSTAGTVVSHRRKVSKC